MIFSRKLPYRIRELLKQKEPYSFNRKYDTQKNIRSPYEGEVVEVLTDRGVVVGLGSPLFKVKNEGSSNTKLAGLKGVLYIPSKDGKNKKRNGSFGGSFYRSAAGIRIY